MDKKEKSIRKECFDKQFYSFGTSKIFEKRANSLKLKRNFITYLGLVIPIFIGAYFLAFTSNTEIMVKILLPVLGLLSIVQVSASLWSIVTNWENQYFQALSSVNSNNSLVERFKRLSEQDSKQILNEFPKVFREYERQESRDAISHVTEKEKRFGMRSALYHYKLSCPICVSKPVSMTPSDCDTCGKF